MSTEDNDPAQDPKQASLLSGDGAAQAADAAVGSAADASAETSADVAAKEKDKAGSASPESTAGAQSAAAAGESGGASDAASNAAPDVAHTAVQAKAQAEVPAADAAGTDAGSDADISEAATVAEPEVPGQLPGELLAARRMEMRLSIEELSARVKLAPRQLIALEANDFGSLPGMATTRGFIRSCAKTMGMDPEPLLAMLANEPNPALGPMVMRRPLPQPGFNGRRYGPSTSHRRSANKLTGLAAVILIFVGMLSYIAWRNEWLQLPSLDFTSSSGAAPDTRPQATEAAAGAEPATPAAEPAVPAAPAATAPATPAPTTAAKTAAAAPASPADNEVYAPAAPAPIAPATPKAEPAKANPAASAAKAANIDPARTLELKLREDSWVEVLTQNGERKLLSRLIKAGSTERIEVTEPLVLVVGNAAGVDVTLRGQPVSLKAGTRDNVAKVNLK